MIKKILPNIYSWSEFSEEKQLNFNGYLIIEEEESVIIDPPFLRKDDEYKISYCTTFIMSIKRNIVDQYSSSSGITI